MYLWWEVSLCASVCVMYYNKRSLSASICLTVRMICLIRWMSLLIRICHIGFFHSHSFLSVLFFVLPPFNPQHTHTPTHIYRQWLTILVYIRWPHQSCKRSAKRPIWRDVWWWDSDGGENVLSPVYKNKWAKQPPASSYKQPVLYPSVFSIRLSVHSCIIRTIHSTN